MDELLDGYAQVLAAAAGGRHPRRMDLDRCRRLGALAAERGVTLPVLVGAYLHRTATGWPGLPGVADAATATEVRAAGSTVLAAVTALVDALADGYASAQRDAAQQSEQFREQFVDDLLNGRGDPALLAERADRFGVLLAGRHIVTVTQAPTPFTGTHPLIRRVDDALAHRFGSRNVLVTTRDGLLVCITSGGLRGAPGELAHHILTALGTDTGWRIGVGRPHSGPAGVLQSYNEARNTLHLAERLGFQVPVLHAADLLVFPVLLRDRAAIADLVRTALGPLVDARGGAEPLLETLSAFFASHGNHAATARRLNISVRAVTYRLDRVQKLTGYAPTEPTQRFTLEAAVLGARLLDWPRKPLDQ
jgi:sugar diacid utilization regulator